MKVVKEPKTIYVNKYVADDGTEFDTQEQCEKYESSDMIWKNFTKCIKKVMYECDVFKDYGYGSEDFHLALIQCNNEQEIKAVNDYVDSLHRVDLKKLDNSYIGELLLCGIGADYSSPLNKTFVNLGTFDELCKKFRRDMEKVFTADGTGLDHLNVWSY